MTASFSSCGRPRGFTYLGVLFAIAFMGVALAMAGMLWSTLDRRAKEKQLLYIGAEFGRALGGYYDGSPGPEKQYPPSLEDLLRDRRYPDTRRYLRKIYADPLTGKAEWGLVRGAGGAIVGVYSLAAGRPVKNANFNDGYSFAGKNSYAEWVFTGRSGAVAGPPGNAQGAIALNGSPGSANADAGSPIRNGAPPVDAAALAELCNAAYAAGLAECEATFPDAQYRQWGSAAKANCLAGAKTQFNQCMKQN